MSRMTSIRWAAGLLAVVLVACGKSDPPPDLIKTQREALEQAKGVEKTIMKSDAAARKSVDDADKVPNK